MERDLEHSYKKGAGFWGSVILTATGAALVLGRTALGSYSMNTAWVILMSVCEASCIGLYFYRFRISRPAITAAGWLRQNGLLPAYFALRILSLCLFGVNWNSLESVYIEFFCLVIVSRYLLSGQRDPELFFKLFIWIVFICNLMALAIASAFYFLADKLHWGPGILNVINGVFLDGKIFTNVNFLGMMTGLALVLSAVYIKPKKWWYVCYVVISLAYLLKVNCRSAEAGLIAVAICYLAVKYIKGITPKKCLMIALALAIGYVGLVFYAAGANSSHVKNFTPLETALNKTGTSRYEYEKYMILSMEPKNWIMGVGSYDAIGQQRYAWVTDPRNGLSPYMVKTFSDPLVKKANNHNSYMDLIIANGALCFILFLAMMIQRVRRIRPPGLNRYYPAILYIMVMANFETVITYAHYHMFFMLMLILVLAEEYGREKETQPVL